MVKLIKNEKYVGPIVSDEKFLKGALVSDSNNITREASEDNEPDCFKAIGILDTKCYFYLDLIPTDWVLESSFKETLKVMTFDIPQEEWDKIRDDMTRKFLQKRKEEEEIV